MLVEVRVKNLSQNMYAFYIHENTDCSEYISDKNQVEHVGNLNGHLSVLVYLHADNKKNAKRNFYIKNMNVKDMKNRSITLALAQDINDMSESANPFVACSKVK